MTNPSNQEFLGRTLQRVYKRIHSRLVDELHDLGYTDITPMQAEVLSCINGEGNSIVSIAKALEITKQAAGELVKQLDSLGYVTKNVSTSDARSYMVVLDGRGEQLIKDATQLKATIEAEYSRLLGERLYRELLKSLKRVSNY